MKIDEIAQANLLYDFYGGLLTKRQRETMELYYEENLSLGEIAGEFGISRQGVSDALKSAVRALEEYESKLGLVEKLQETNRAVGKIDGIIDEIIGGLQGTPQKEAAEEAVKKLEIVKEIIDKLEE